MPPVLQNWSINRLIAGFRFIRFGLRELRKYVVWLLKLIILELLIEDIKNVIEDIENVVTRNFEKFWNIV